MASSVKQWLTSLDGLDKLRQTVAPMPSPGPGQVLVEVHAVSLNYRDIEGTFYVVVFFILVWCWNLEILWLDSS